MPAPLIIWGGLAVAGLVAGGWAARQAGEAAEDATELVKWTTAAGTVYVSYRALRAAGVLKGK